VCVSSNEIVHLSPSQLFISDLKLLPRMRLSQHQLADIPGAPPQLSHRDLKDPEILGFSVRLQLPLSFSNWSLLQSFSNSKLHHLELGVSARLPQLSALPSSSSSLSEVPHSIRHLY
jgi:hypothetical protein